MAWDVFAAGGVIDSSAPKDKISVSGADNSCHEECLTMFGEGIRAANKGDSMILTCINKSGYQVSTTADAVKLLDDFRAIYLKEYGRSRR